MPQESSVNDSKQECGRQTMSIFQKRARLRKKIGLGLEHVLLQIQEKVGF